MARDYFAYSHTVAGSLIQELLTEAEVELSGFGRPPTITRIMGDIFIDHTQGANVAEVADVALGIMNIEATAGASLPSLLTVSGLERPWMWLRFGRVENDVSQQVRFTSAGAEVGFSTAFGDGCSSRVHFQVDVRAQRILRLGQRLILFTTMAEFVGTPDVQVSGSLRFLLKEA